jgi:hypothetical protein
MNHTWHFDHGRAGMIPRWKEDNVWFHQRDVTRALKKGRKHWHNSKSYDKFGKSSHFCGLWELEILANLCHLKNITV